MMNLQIVKDILSRYPLPLVDEILELKEGKMAVGVKQINKEDTFATGQIQKIQLCQAFLSLKRLHKLQQ